MPDDLELKVGGVKWSKFNSLKCEMSLDGFASLSFVAPFNPDSPSFRSTFRPFSYPSVQVTLGRVVLFTGTMVTPQPEVSADERSVSVSAYSAPAVLGDCHVPVSAYPIECNGMGLRQIVSLILAPFGLSSVFESDPGASFRRVRVKPEETPFSFLSDLAKQRGLVVGDTPEGALAFRRSATSGPPVVRLREGTPPLTEVGVSFSGQAYYSEITGVAKGRVGSVGSAYTLKNPHASGFVRPHVFELDDTDSADVPTAVQAKMGRMFASAVSYSASIPSWYDAGGRVILPNKIVSLEAESAMVYRETDMLIRSVTLLRDEEKETASLELVLPGAFSGQVPSEVPWA